jgi:dolichol-phosphate mannosyltransferase
MKVKTRTRSLISICVPVLNEELNIEKLYKELAFIAEKVSMKYKFEFIFTDNDSEDQTWTKIKEIGKHDSRIKGFRFAKNVGFQQSVLFGYMQARGSAAIQIDADLQDPPEVILDFLKGWEQGFKVVVGVRQNRPENFILTTFRRFGYYFISKVSDFRITQNAGDFRLIDREVIEVLRKSNNPNPYLRGAIAKIGLPEKSIFYTRNQRKLGTSKFGIKNILSLGLSGIINYSNILQKFALMIFGTTTLLSLAGIIILVYSKFTFNSILFPRGFASIAILILSTITINSLFFSIVIHYLQKLHSILIKDDFITVLDKI